MATVKKTLSIDTEAWAFAERAAARVRSSPSAWASRQLRQQAILLGYSGNASDTEAEAEALADEEEAALAEG